MALNVGSIANVLVPNPFTRPGPSLYNGPGLPSSYSDQIELPEKADVALVFDSIRQIIETSQGERLLEPEFGSRVRELIFEPITLVFEQKVKLYVTEAIRKYEPRVKLVDVTFAYSQNEVRIKYDLLFLQIGRTFQGSVSMPRSI